MTSLGPATLIAEIITKSVFEQVVDTTNALNGLAELIWQYREYVLEIIGSTVSITGEDEADVDAYAERAEIQEKGDVYLEALKTIFAEYRFGLTGERSAL